MPKNFDEFKDQVYSKYNLESEKTITENDLDLLERIADLESKKAKEKDRDQKENAQRKMAWVSLFSMITYPLIILITSWLNLTNAAEILGSMANIYFASVAAILAAFFGSQAYQSSHETHTSFSNRSPKDH